MNKKIELLLKHKNVHDTYKGTRCLGLDELVYKKRL